MQQSNSPASVPPSPPSSPLSPPHTSSSTYNRYLSFRSHSPQNAALVVGALGGSLVGCGVGLAQYIFQGIPPGRAVFRAGVAGSLTGALYGGSLFLFEERAPIVPRPVRHAVAGAFALAMVGGVVNGSLGAKVNALLGLVIAPIGYGVVSYLSRPKAAQIVLSADVEKAKEAARRANPVNPFPKWIPIRPSTPEEIKAYEAELANKQQK